MAGRGKLFQILRRVSVSAEGDEKSNQPSSMQQQSSAEAQQTPTPTETIATASTLTTATSPVAAAAFVSPPVEQQQETATSQSSLASKLPRSMGRGLARLTQQPAAATGLTAQPDIVVETSTQSITQMSSSAQFRGVSPAPGAARMSSSSQETELIHTEAIQQSVETTTTFVSQESTGAVPSLGLGRLTGRGRGIALVSAVRTQSQSSTSDLTSQTRSRLQSLQLTEENVLPIPTPTRHPEIVPTAQPIQSVQPPQTVQQAQPVQRAQPVQPTQPVQSTLIQEPEQKVEAKMPLGAEEERRSVRTSSDEQSTRTAQRQTTQIVSIATSSSLVRASDELAGVEYLVPEPKISKPGESGTKVNYQTNYVRLRCKNKAIYQYVVHYDPPVDSQAGRKSLLFATDAIGPVRLFDGYVLYLPHLLPDQVTTKYAKRRNDTTDTKITIQLTKVLPPEQIPPIIFNIIFKNVMKELKMTRIGQHYFSSERQIEVPNHSLQIWPGYTTAVHELEDGLYLIIDVAHKILRSKTCWDLMNDLYEQYGKDMGEFRAKVTENLVGSIVLTKYNNKTYRVDDIEWAQNPESEFAYRGGSTSYVNYYSNQYGIKLFDHQQPLLLNRPKKAKVPLGSKARQELEIICLIPELCFLTGLSEQFRNDMTIKKELSAHTRLTPNQRVEQLRFLIRNIRECPAAIKHINQWGLELEDDLFSMEGRLLVAEKVCFAKREVETDAKCDWTRPVGNEEVLKAVGLTDWICVYPLNKEQIIEKFVMMAQDSSRRIGITIQMPKACGITSDKPEIYYNEIKKNITSSTQMVLIVFPNLSDARYMRVKRLCCVECPIPSQVVVLKTINKPDNVLRTVAQKILLQMNCKLGGELWKMKVPIKNLMIVGIDTYHKTEKRYQSIAGLVASLNSEGTRWYSKVCFQMVGQELTDTLKPAFKAALNKYREVNGVYPEKVFIFRDGVSEGQLSLVYDHEVKQLKECFAADYAPKLTMVVVQKRINTRIFANGPSNEKLNPKPGTVIDYMITSRRLFDFFLVSQHVGQGTVSPTHYIVLYDEAGFRPDHIQKLAYKMTHMYYNWSGTIRVPAPCQYAHKLAFLTGQYLQEEPAELLCNRLFYL